MLSISTGVATTLGLMATLMVANLIQVSTLLIRPFSARQFRRANRWIANWWWGLCELTMRRIHRTEIILSGDLDLPDDENAILVANHQATADILVLFPIAEAHGRLGDLKFFVKDIVKYVPGVGWGMLFLDCPFLKRNWSSDQHAIAKIFDKILTFSVPIWLVSYVEGTRLTPSKIEGARRFAKERGLTLHKHVLVPRSKGFVASFFHLRAHLDAVYDITIGYIDGRPTLWQWACGHLRRVRIDIRRFPIASLPEDPELLAAWLHERFDEKDNRLDEWLA